MIRKLFKLRQLSKPPVFIAGCGRSGTTLLLAVLSADPSLFCISVETEAFKRVHKPTRARLWLARLKIYAHILRQATPILQQVRWVEKTPIHIRKLDWIQRAYGNRARFIILVRDGRDVITSRHPSHPEIFHVQKERWVLDVCMGEKYENDPRAVVIRYEDLIRDFAGTIGKIYRLLDQVPPPEMLNYQSHAEVRRHIAWAGEVTPLSASSIERWRKPELAARVNALMAMSEARRLLGKYGYLESAAAVVNPPGANASQ